jgi:hypothetical protein
MAAAVTVAMGLVGSALVTPAAACTFTDLRQAAATAGSAQAIGAARFAASLNAPALAVSADAASAAQTGNGSHPNAPIVGMWRFAWTAPDGVSLIDWGFQQWHDDSTELTNSGGQLPATGNFCMGTWKQRGGSYQLNHWAMAWNLPGTDPSDFVGLINIKELVDVDFTGNHMTGTVSLDLYDGDGITHLAHLVDGTVAATRVTP